MKVELDSKVYTDLLEIMDYYDGEGEEGLASKWTDDFLTNGLKYRYVSYRRSGKTSIEPF